MTAFRTYDYVQTPNGKGTIQWRNSDGTFQVWILRKEFHGEYPPKFNDHSPTIALNFKPDELEFA